LEEDFAILADAGVKHTQVWVWDNRIEPGDLRIADNVVRWADKHGVGIDSVHGPSGYPTARHWLANPDQAAREWAVKQRRLALQTSARLGAKYMIMEYEVYDRWPFWPHESPIETWYYGSPELFNESFAQAAEEAAVQGVRIALENVSSISVSEQMKLLSNYPPELVGICFDSCHSTYGHTFHEQLDCLFPRLIATHLSDSDGLEGIQWNDRHWPPFTGVIDWQRLMKQLVSAPGLDMMMVETICSENTVTPEVTASLRKLEKLVEECERIGDETNAK